jgi:glycosyltransferase involved in cell wall biosynthesis
MPLISVIIPTYNRGRFVVKAIESVLRQSFTDLEVIVIDDGSTDGTRKVLETYSGKIRYVFQENAGVSSARNSGIRKARGEWVAFLDSDDEWTRDYLSAQMTQVRNVNHAVAHITNAVTVYEDGKRINQFGDTKLLDRFNSKPCLTYERPLSVIIKHSPWFIQSSIIRRDVLVKAGLFDEGLSIAEDLDVIARVAIRGPVTFCKAELVEVYRRNEQIENLGAQSVKRGIYSYKAFGKVYANLLSSPELSWIEKATIARALSTNWRGLGNALVMGGKKIEARRFYRKSLFLYPTVQSLIKFLATFLPLKISRALVRSGRHILMGEDTVQEEG